MEAFWAKGYESTSLNDLMAATGLHKGSLYQAFGDKHSLFIEALKRYLGEMMRVGREAVEGAATPLDGLRSFAHRIIDLTGKDDGVPKGCMALNALVELAPHDPEVRELLQAQVARARSGITGMIAAAQEAGQISAERSPELVAKLFLTFVWGLSISMKGYIDKAEAHALLDAQMETL